MNYNYVHHPCATSVRLALRRIAMGLWIVGLMAAVFSLCSLRASAREESVTSSVNKVKAAFLRNFAHYVTWPTNQTADGQLAWRIGVLGTDPFGDLLESTFAGRVEQGRHFVVHRAETMDDLPPCDIVYIVEKDVHKRRALLATFKDQPVLTVGDAPSFLQEGGIIRFQVDTHVKISVNLDQARAVSLKISSQMLEVSEEVLENGTLRKLR